MNPKLKLPSFFSIDKFDSLFTVDYESIKEEALIVKKNSRVNNFYKDSKKNALIISGVQINEMNKNKDILFNICKFIYENAVSITDIYIFLETSHPISIKSNIFWMNVKNEHPKSNYIITHKDFVNKKWKVNPGMYKIFSQDNKFLDKHVDLYLKVLSDEGVYLKIESDKASNFDINSSIAPSLSEALFYFSILKNNQIYYNSYNDNPLVKNKTLFTRYLKEGAYGGSFMSMGHIVKNLSKYDRLIICGIGHEIVENTIRYMYNESYQLVSLYDCSDYNIDNLHDLRQDIFINMQDF